MKMFENIKAAYGADSETSDRGDAIVQTILIIAGFAIVVILAVNWIGTAVLNKGADVAQCIEGSNTYNASKSAQNCESANHAKDKSFTNDSGYKGRY